MLNRLFHGVIFSLLMLGSVSADVIELNTGQRLEGEVLKESDDAVFIDLGVDVIKIPRDRIRSRETVTTSNKETQSAAKKPELTVPHC
jgi:membrane protein involved in colicin uptake